MPGFSGTGPTNTGPMTGRGRGYCLKEFEPGVDNFATGCGFGRGIGRGRGRGFAFKRERLNTRRQQILAEKNKEE